MLDQLAGEDQKARGVPQPERLIAFIEKARQLARESGGAGRVETVGITKADPRLGRVADDKFQLGVLGAAQHLRKVVHAVDAARNHADKPFLLRFLAVFHAAQIERVQTVLRGEFCDVSPGVGGDDNDFSVKAGKLVGKIKKAVGKRPQKISVTELNDALRRVLEVVSAEGKAFQSRIA